MIQVINFLTDHPLVKLWDIPLLSTLSGNKKEKLARSS